MKHLQPEHKLVGLRVYVYFNLHRKCFSVKALEGEHRGRVVHHTDSVALLDVTFKVSQKGRERVLRTKRKNVHAGVSGTFVTTSPCYEPLLRHYWCKGQPVTYNPYKYKQFVNADTLQPVHTAGAVILNGRTITRYGDYVGLDYTPKYLTRNAQLTAGDYP